MVGMAGMAGMALVWWAKAAQNGVRTPPEPFFWVQWSNWNLSWGKSATEPLIYRLGLQWQSMLVGASSPTCKVIQAET